MTTVDPTPGAPGPEPVDVLRTSLDLLAVAFDHGPLALTITALDDGRLVAVNDVFVRTTGYSREETIGRSPDELRLWVEPQRRAERFAQLMAGRSVPDIEARFRLKNGEIRVGIVGSALVDIAGRRCVLTSVVDITDRAVAEKKVRASEERYRAIVESQVEMICRFSADGEILFVNAAYASALGVTADQLVGRNFWAFVEPADRQAVKAQLDRMSPSVPELSIENRFETADGVRWTLWTNRALAFDSDGRPTELQSSGIDITDRKARERDAAFLGAMTHELSQLSDPHEIIRRVAAAIVEHLGAIRCVFTELDSSHQQLEVIGEASRDGTPLRTSLRLQDFFSDELLTHLGSGRQVAVSDTCEDPRTKDHEANFARLQVRAFVTTPYVSDGIWKGSLAVHVDEPRPWSTETLALLSGLSGRIWARLERARAEQRLRESEAELRRASEIKDAFLATLSHELRTPLNAVLGWAHMLRTGTVSPEAVPRALEAVERNAQAQSQLVDDLLDMSRIMSGNLPIRNDLVDLGAVAAAAEEAIRPAAISGGVTMELDVPTGPALQVRGDADRLRQVLCNLLANAVRFTPAGGHVQLRMAPDGADAVIVVRDTGEGIAPAFLPLVFERFRQADSSTTRRHSGLGLGLAITRHLVEAHGGSVTAHSDGVGQGATFTVRLPTARA